MLADARIWRQASRRRVVATQLPWRRVAVVVAAGPGGPCGAAREHAARVVVRLLRRLHVEEHFVVLELVVLAEV